MRMLRSGGPPSPALPPRWVRRGSSALAAALLAVAARLRQQDAAAPPPPPGRPGRGEELLQAAQWQQDDADAADHFCSIRGKAAGGEAPRLQLAVQPPTPVAVVGPAHHDVNLLALLLGSAQSHSGGWGAGSGGGGPGHGGLSPEACAELQVCGATPVLLSVPPHCPGLRSPGPCASLAGMLVMRPGGGVPDDSRQQQPAFAFTLHPARQTQRRFFHSSLSHGQGFYVARPSRP